MAIVRKTITLTEQQDNWVKAQIQAGHYTNDSEYIRDLIRREQDRSSQVAAVQSGAFTSEARSPTYVVDLQSARVQDIQAGMDEADLGDFASDDEVIRVFAKYGA